MCPIVRSFEFISAQDALARRQSFSAILDVRSEDEYAIDRFPGAANHPVLDNRERAEVGTMYKQVSPFDARKLGAALVARNIARHLEGSFRSNPRDWSPLVYCWRGGNRSAAMGHVLAQIGWRVHVLRGGYQEYRREVVRRLADLPQRLRFVVLCGPTGCGKSRLLTGLAEQSAQVLDLEALARHRGSVLGPDPRWAQPSQKGFESSLFTALSAFDPARPVYVESESARIGALRVPEELLANMRAAPCVRIDTSFDDRIALLSDDYRHLREDLGLLFARLDQLLPLHGRQTITRWMLLAEQGRWNEFVAALLREHYDPAYARSTSRNFLGHDAAMPLPVSLHADPGLANAARRLVESFEPANVSEGALVHAPAPVSG